MLKQLKKDRASGFTLIELMIVVAIIGILAAIAIPNFIKFQARAKQSEAKANMKAVFSAQKAYYSEHDAYIDEVDVVGFAPERNNRYAYYLAPGVVCNTRIAPTEVHTANSTCIEVDKMKYSTAAVAPTWVAPSTAGTFDNTNSASVDETAAVFDTCPTCGFSANAAGNIDNDTIIDSWYISSESASGAAEACSGATVDVPAGEPMNTNNDVNC